jgi:hypothetical protein
MRVDAAQAGEPSFGAAKGAEVGDDDLFIVAHNGEDNLALAVADDTYLASDFERELGEETGKLRSDDLLRGDAAAVDPLQGLDLTRPQADGIAEYSLDRSPRERRDY